MQHVRKRGRSVAADLRLAVLRELRQCEGRLPAHIGLRIAQANAHHLHAAGVRGQGLPCTWGCCTCWDCRKLPGPHVLACRLGVQAPCGWQPCMISAMSPRL